MFSRSSRARTLAGIAAVATLALTACSDTSSDTDNDAAGDSGESYSIGINQLVQHPALDAAAEGFKLIIGHAGVFRLIICP